jgi:hypothetical protein
METKVRFAECLDTLGLMFTIDCYLE